MENRQRSRNRRDSNYVYRQLGQLGIIPGLPMSQVPTEPVINSALDVKSAVMTYVAVNLSHQYNRVGVAGRSLTDFILITIRLAPLYFWVTKRSNRRQ